MTTTGVVREGNHVRHRFAAALKLARGFRPHALLVPVFSAICFLPKDVTAEWAWHLLADQLINLCAVFGAGMALLAMRFTRFPLSYLGALVTRVSRYRHEWLVGAMACTFFFTACVLSGNLFSHLPHVADSQAHYIMAKIIASGHFTLPVHPLQEFFPIEWFGVRDGKLYGSYPPGHALLLALGILVGLPWVINPLLGAATVVAVYYLGCEVGNRRTGLLASCLALVSPFLVFMSSEYMSHATALLAETVFILFYLRTIRTAGWRDGLLAGCAVGYLVLTRPQCAAIIAPVYIIHVLAACLSDLRRYACPFAATAAGCLPFLLFFLAYNGMTTGDPLLTGYQTVHGVSREGFTSLHADSFPLGDLKRAASQSGTLGVEFFCWPVPSFALMAWGFAKCARRRGLCLLASTFLTTWLGLCMILVSWTNLFSIRLLYEVSGALIVLAALGFQSIASAAMRSCRAGYRDAVVGFAACACLALCVCGLFNRTGELYRIYENHYWEGNADYYRDIVGLAQAPSLVFIPADQLKYVATLMPASLHAPIIFAQNLPAKLQLLIDYYPDRNVYMVAPLPGKGLLGDYGPQVLWLTSGGCLSSLPGYYIGRLK